MTENHYEKYYLLQICLVNEIMHISELNLKKEKKNVLASLSHKSKFSTENGRKK